MNHKKTTTTCYIAACICFLASIAEVILAGIGMQATVFLSCGLICFCIAEQMKKDSGGQSSDRT